MFTICLILTTALLCALFLLVLMHMHCDDLTNRLDRSEALLDELAPRRRKPSRPTAQLLVGPEIGEVSRG